MQQIPKKVVGQLTSCAKLEFNLKQNLRVQVSLGTSLARVLHKSNTPEEEACTWCSTKRDKHFFVQSATRTFTHDFTSKHSSVLVVSSLENSPRRAFTRTDFVHLLTTLRQSSLWFVLKMVFMSSL